MKFLLAAVGSKYVHCNLAIYSLRAYVQAAGVCSEVETAEYTINQNREEILADLYSRKPDAVGFSCYIWNICLIEALARDFHTLRPEADIWFGGPEASGEAREWMERLPFLRGIMVGEGEETFCRLIRYYDGGQPAGLSGVSGIFWRGKGGIRENPRTPALSMAQIPFPFDGPLPRDKIVYYESSRGCPFSCGYCLSSVDKKLRFRDWELVKRELSVFLEQRVRQVKFVDRTFNCSHSHSRRIWRYLAGQDNGVTNFHFEIAGDLLEEEDLEILGSLRPGLVQLEIGVQSTNPDALRAVRRTTNLERLEKNVRRLAEGKNIHIHLDLIAGLPFEDYKSFGRSFDRVYALRPEKLQLGFLKLLKGSPLYEQVKTYGICHSTQPPYEVLGTPFLSYEDLCRLKRIEKVLDIYGNSHQFVHVMERLLSFYPSPFVLYEKLAEYFEENGLFSRQTSRLERFSILWDFICREKEEREFLGVVWQEVLVYDYFLRENAKVRPAFAPDLAPFWPSITEWYAKYALRRPELGSYAGRSYRQLLHMTHAEVFHRDFSQNGQKILIVFDYEKRSPLTGNAATWEGEEWTKENGSTRF